MLTVSIIVLIVGLSVGALIALLWGRREVQRHLTSVYGVRHPKGIDELIPVNIGGIDQWLHIRGQNKDKPILLYVHGGPGWPNIGWHDAIQRPWENYFTVVQWDQRQTGKSYQPLKKIGDTLTEAQLISDAEEVIKYLRQRFNRQKIVMMATSYGTVISMHLVKQHPDWFYAYIGIGQAMTMTRHARGEYDFLLEYATEHGLDDFKAKLLAMEPYPDPNNIATSFFANGNVLMDHSSRFGKGFPDCLAALFSMAAMGKWISPHYTLKDNLNRKFGDVPDATHPFAQDMVNFDLPKQLGNDFEAPIFFFSGRHDFHISHRTTDEWFEAINAPVKKQIFFEDSAHVPYQTEPGAFLFALVNEVLPLTQEHSHNSDKDSVAA